MKTKKIILFLTAILSGILLTPLYGNAQTAGAQKDLFNPDTIFNYVFIGVAVAFFVAVLWVLTSAMRNLSDALKKDSTHNLV